RHFADKGALLAAVAAEGFQRLSALVQQAIDAHAGQPRQLLPEAGWAYVRFALEHPDHLRVMFSNRIGDYAAYPGLLDTAMDALGRLTHAITRAQAAGHVAPGDPFRLTLSTWAMLHGIATLMIEQKLPGMDCSDPAAMEPVARQMLGVYFNGLQQGLPEVTP
ncbi:MAG: WHG domain-containing protein, partial [Anaerolineales bacterium]|nr:WHG domain-containing protein [Anaerolineales bacterium]